MLSPRLIIFKKLLPETVLLGRKPNVVLVAQDIPVEEIRNVGSGCFQEALVFVANPKNSPDNPRTILRYRGVASEEFQFLGREILNFGVEVLFVWDGVSSPLVVVLMLAQLGFHNCILDLCN